MVRILLEDVFSSEQRRYDSKLWFFGLRYSFLLYGQIHIRYTFENHTLRYSPAKKLSPIRSFVNILFVLENIYLLGHLKLVVYRINIIHVIRTVCQRQRQRSGGDVGRAQENFSFEHLGSRV